MNRMNRYNYDQRMIDKARKADTKAKRDALAAKYGVSYLTIYKIWSGRTFREVAK